MHLALEQLSYIASPRPSFGLRAANPATTLALFVHGFSGSALDTWRQFDSLAPAQAAFDHCDLAFLGYESVTQQTNASAALLFSCCAQLIADAANFTHATISHQTLRRPSNHKYERVVFVAHSLGAVVTRQLLLIAEQKAVDWLAQVELILFAPAHQGATNIAKLPGAVAAIFGKFGVLAGALIGWKAQTIRELEQGSATLLNLRDRTHQSLIRRETQGQSLGHLIAKQIYFGANEDVVDMNPFERDVPCMTLPNHNHTSVCKPRGNYLIPLDFLS